MPLVLPGLPEVRADTSSRSAIGAPKATIFSPSITQPSPSRVALVATDTSKCAPRSVWASASFVLPSTTPGSTACFWASLPARSTSRPTRQTVGT